MKRLSLLFFLLLALFPPSLIAGWHTETAAGTGIGGSSGDGGPATKAQVNSPFGVLRGPDGLIYFCEYDGHVICRIDAQGNLYTVAGIPGKAGYSGDGGPATQAKLNRPHEIRFGPDGNLYAADMANQVIRKVDMKTGIISTFAGIGGKSGFAGDGGPASKALLNKPHSLQFSPDGSLYICDIGNNRIRKVDAKTGIISSFAGTGKKGATPDGAAFANVALNGPRTIDFDRQGRMWLALREGNQVYRLDLKEGTIHHIAGTGKKGFTGNGGPAKSATLSGPKGIAIGPDGRVWLADTESHSIRVIDPATGLIHLVCGTGKPGDGPDGDALGCKMKRPHGVYVEPDGTVWIGDMAHRVRVLRPAADKKSPAPNKPKRPEVPTRAFDAPEAPSFIRLDGKAGANPPVDANGNYVIGPKYEAAPERQIDRDAPQGKVLQFSMDSREGKLYNPGIAREKFGTPDPNNSKTLIVETHEIDYTRTITVYIPAQYKPGTEAPFTVIHDGPKEIGKPGSVIPNIFNNLIHQRRVPPMIAIMIANGGGDAQGHERGREYDNMSGMFAEYIESEVLPRVEKSCDVKLSKDPNARAAMGSSSGGSAALIMAWFRPDLYRRVLTTSGTFVNQAWPFDPAYPDGAWGFHETLIPNSAPKPLRIFMAVGDRDLLNPNVMRDGMHDWVEANHRMAKVLKAKDYDYQYLFCLNARHGIGNAKQQILPHALEWVWHGYPIAKD